MVSLDTRRHVIRHVREAAAGGARAVVVVSAMGRRGDPYATDTLLDLLRGTGSEVDPRDYDSIFVCGEMISSAVLSHELKMHGLGAVALTGSQAGVFTDDVHIEAEIQEVEASCVEKLLQVGIIPVVTGCQGVLRSTGEFTTLGRGGSDTSAVALGVALKAGRVEVFTDVEGVFRADPRLVPDAELLPTIDFETMLELASFGAGVVHPRAIRAGAEAGTPIVVRSTFGISSGTEISGSQAPQGVVAIAAAACVGTTPVSYTHLRAHET